MQFLDQTSDLEESGHRTSVVEYAKRHGYRYYFWQGCPYVNAKEQWQAMGNGLSGGGSTSHTSDSNRNVDSRNGGRWATAGVEEADQIYKLKNAGLVRGVDQFMQRVLAVEYLLKTDPTVEVVVQLDLDICIKVCMS
jgi:hypothetical protein